MFRPLKHTSRIGLACIALILAACGSSDAGDQPALPTPLGTATPAAAPPPASGDAAVHVRAADAALKAGDFSAAEREYRQAAELEPSSADAQFGLGNVYFQLNRLFEAEKAYQAALVLDPNLAAAHTNLGVVYYQMEQLDRAAEELGAALQIEPDDPQSLYMLAAVRLQQNDLPTAEELLVKARDSKPDLPEVYYALGVLYRLRGQREDAIAAFERFLELGPGQDPSAVDHANEELRSLRGQ